MAATRALVRCYLLPSNGAAAAVPAHVGAAGAGAQLRKTVYFVRHGRGQHNQAADEGGDAVYDDEAYFDSELVEDGLAQAAQAGVTLRGTGVQCVVSSPLTRCLQTASLACANDAAGMGGASTRHVVLEHVRESCKYGQHPCNRRRAKEEVAPKFPLFDFGLIEAGCDTVWGLEQGKDGEGAMVQARGRRFLAWLAQQPEDTFAVFSHCVFLHQLLDRVLDMQPCTATWNEGKDFDPVLKEWRNVPNCSWFDKGQVQGFVLVYPSPTAAAEEHSEPPASTL